jgi:hypothetical protein
LERIFIDRFDYAWDHDRGGDAPSIDGRRSKPAVSDRKLAFWRNPRAREVTGEVQQASALVKP